MQKGTGETDLNFRDLFTPLTNTKIFFFLLIIGFITFFPTLFNNFLGDDYYLLLTNPLVTSIHNIPKLFFGSIGSQGGQFAGLYYRPLMLTYITILNSFFGPNPFFFHLIQLIIHIMNAFLVFKIFTNFFRKNISFVLALIFLIHPINVEAVVYVAAIQEILFMFFGLLMINFIFVKSQTISFLAILLLTPLSLLSKETGILLVITLLFYYLLFKRIKLIPYLSVSFLGICIYLLLRIGVAHVFFSKQPPNLITNTDIFHRVLTIPAMLQYYFSNLLFPLHLVMPQVWIVKNLTLSNFYMSLLFDLIFFGAIIFFGIKLKSSNKNNSRAFIFFFIWFLIGIIIHLQFIPLDYIVSDRWFYFPIIGFLGISGVIYSNIRNISTEKTKLFNIIFICLILLLSVRTFIRTTNWKGGLTLWGHDIKYSKNNMEIENAYGFALIGARNYKDARIHLEKSVSIYPNSSNLTNLGAACFHLGDVNKAEFYFRKAVVFNDYYLPFENLVILLYSKKDYQKTQKFLAVALKRFPYSAKLWYIGALVEYRLGNNNNAINSAKKSYLLSPNGTTLEVYKKLKDNLPLEQ